MNVVKDLLTYLGSEGQTFFIEYITSISNDKAVDDNVFFHLMTIKVHRRVNFLMYSSFFYVPPARKLVFTLQLRLA